MQWFMLHRNTSFFKELSKTPQLSEGMDPFLNTSMWLHNMLIFISECAGQTKVSPKHFVHNCKLKKQNCTVGVLAIWRSGKKGAEVWKGYGCEWQKNIACTLYEHLHSLAAFCFITDYNPFIILYLYFKYECTSCGMLHFMVSNLGYLVICGDSQDFPVTPTITTALAFRYLVFFCRKDINDGHKYLFNFLALSL